MNAIPTLFRTLAICLWVIGWLSTNLASAQVTEPPASPAPATPTPPAAQIDPSPSGNRPLRESGPPVMFLQNKKGEWVVVPSTITIDVLERLLQLERGILPTTPPRYTFSDTIQLTGQANGGVAEVDASFAVRIAAPAADQGPWVRVPLRLNQAILTAPIEVSGIEDYQTDYQSEGDGHVVWLRTADRTDVRIRLKFRVPIVVGNAEHRLELTLPNRSSNLRLTVASGAAEGRVGDESSVLAATNRRPEGGTEFVVDSSGGSTQFFWRDAPEAPPVLYAEGNIVVELAGRSFDADALLRVRSYGPPIDSFTVRLPANVEWLGSGQTPTAGVQVAPLATTPAASGQILLVRRLEGKTANPIEVRIKVSSKASAAEPPSPIVISGFEVVGAQIQRGTIDFVLKGNPSVEWNADANLRRVDVPDSVRSQDVAARFEYDRPFSLQANVGKGDPRISVEPTYIVNIDPTQLKLDASLRYRISGGRAEKLIIGTRGWTIDRITLDEGTVGAWKVDKETVEVPVPAAINGRGEFELALGAHQSLTPSLPWNQTLGQLPLPGMPVVPHSVGESWLRQLGGQATARDLTFTLPQPMATASTPAVLVVAPADNVELSPTPDQIRLLVPDALPPQVNLPARQQPPLVYREDVTGQMPVFAGSFKIRRQSISVQVENTVRVEERDLGLEQRMVFQISYEPASVLTFDVPKDLREAGELEVYFDGTLLTIDPVPGTNDSSPDRERVLIDLPEPQLGACELIFRYKVPRNQLVTPDSPTLTAALVRPVQTESLRITASSLNLTSAATLRVSLLDDLMRPVEDEVTEATIGDDLSFQLDQVPSHISILPQSTEGATRRSTLIDRVWVQALLTPTQRRDRACFRISTNESYLTFLLPRGVSEADVVSVVVDGRRNDQFTLSPTGELRLRLEDSFGPRQLTVELWYWFTAQPAVLGKLHFEAPRLENGSHAEHVLWELLLPVNEHLVWAERSLIPEYVWRWQGLYFARVPLRDQKNLEEWVQATTRPETPGFNRYLFSSVGARDSYEVVTVLRAFATFAIAVSVFCGGALFMYVAFLRHPIVLLGIGCLLIALAISFPEACLAASQIIGFGLVFVVVARLSMAMLTRRPVSPIPRRSGNSGISDSRSSRTILRRAEALAGGGTATISAPSPLQVSATGNEP